MSDIIGDFCDETAHISTIFVDYIKVLAPSMLAHGHRLFVFEKQHERGRNAVPFVVKGKRNQLALANQPLRFRMIIKVHSTSFCLSPSSYSWGNNNALACFRQKSRVYACDEIG